ncbi:MAG: hypothetical protein ABFD92_06635 [Planctomycetaceae bacterium]|nr:hypothetical protein [Planctomycetaceae bacterium]
MSDSPPPKSAHAPAAGKSPRLRATLYVLLLVAGILLAWQMHRFFFQRPEGPAADKLARWMNAQMPSTAPADGAGDPVELARRPESAAGLVPLTGPPAGLAPMAGATLGGAWQRRVGAYVEEFARYRVASADAAAVAEHYKTVGAKAGFSVAGDRDGPSQRTLSLTRSGWRVVVLIAPAPSRGVSVTVAATQLPPPPSRP